jgi:hypothetical protein
VDYRDELLNLRTACKLKLPHLTERGADQATATERQKEKTPPTNKPSGKTTTEFLLKYQHQDRMLEKLHRT